MKKLLLLVMLVAVSATSLKAQKMEAPVRAPFDNVALGIQAGVMGYGVSLATPLCSFLYARAGFSYQYLPLGAFNQAMDVQVGTYTGNPTIGLKPTFKYITGQLLFDFVPFRSGTSAFFITAGFYAGNDSLADVAGTLDQASITELEAHGIHPSDVSVKIGDTPLILDPDWSVAGKAQVWKFRPYVGLGFGRPVPVHRVGFRFEMGVLFHGKPSIVSDNLPNGLPDDTDLATVNKILNKLTVMPQIQFTLTFRLLKDKAKENK